MATGPTTGQSPRITSSNAASGQRLSSFFSPGSLIGLLAVVGRRLWGHLSLMLTIGAGFVVAIALVISIPVYAEAVGYRVLRDELTESTSGGTLSSFAFVYRYFSGQSGQIDWNRYVQVDTAMRERPAQLLGLPIERRIRYVATEKLSLVPPGGTRPLLAVNLAFASELEQQITLIDGQWPRVSPAGPVEVLMSEELAGRLGFQVGEEHVVLGPRGDPNAGIPIRIAGVWRPNDPRDPYWFSPPSSFNETLFMPEESYATRLAPRNPRAVFIVVWYLVADGSSVRSDDAPAVQARIAGAQRALNDMLPGIRNDRSPSEALGRHRERVRHLTVILTVFSIPVLGLISYFVTLVAGLIVQRQSGEIAVLRSRGASRLQVLVVYLVEGALLGLAALLLGAQLGQLAAFVMTWTRSFLDLVPGEQLPIETTAAAWRNGLQMLGLLLLASLLPAFAAARYTIVSYKSERARDTRRPFWQRAYLDMLLLVPVYYGYRQLQQRGTIAILGVGGASADPFANPLLLLLPTLYVFGLALIAARLFPIVTLTLAWLFSRLPGIAALTALRYLARTPRAYAGPVLLLTLTLSLAIFTASMAATLDRHLFDQIRYQTGADMRVTDTGQTGGPLRGGSSSGGVTQPTPDSDGIGETLWMFLPVTDYLTIPGVQAVTRVADSPVDINMAGRTIAGRFIGIDRIDFPNVAYWRSGFADEPLGELMNRLADDPGAVLVSRAFALQQGLRIGDRLTVRMNNLGEPQDVPVVVAGYLKLFPTAYPEDGPFVVGNLEYAFDQQGGQFPYDVWLRLAEETSRESIIDGAHALDLRIIPRDYAPREIAAERARPERQGLYGLLSVGFVAAAGLTVLGFLFYAVLSFQRRYVELGVMRAIGLGSRQLGALLAWEQALIIGAGALAGTLIGISACELFIPFLQLRGGEHPLTPPFVVRIAWEQIALIYLVFGAILLLAVLVTLALLRRLKLFQAIKLGEAV